MTNSISKKLYNQLNFGFLQKLIISLIIISSFIVIIETEKSIYYRYQTFFNVIKYFFGIIFIIEYILRIYVSGNSRKYKGFKGKINYITNFWSLIDLFAILPFFIAGTNETFLLRLFRLLRLLSVIRVGRYSVALRNVLIAISNRKYELFFAIVISFTLLIVSSSFMYLLEAEAQPEAFGSILRCMWWAAAALTTVGYGDVYPITFFGKAFAIISAFSSIGIVALPAGILAGSFTEKFRKKNK